MSSVREPLDIVETARDAVEELGLDVEIQVSGNTAAVVEADPDQIHQIFVNLLVNARRYGTPPIRIQIESDDRDVTVRVSDEASRHFGVTAAIHSTPDYALCQRWAAAFADAGFDGINYLASHDPSVNERSVAIFQGSAKAEKLARLMSSDIGEEVIRDVDQRYGIVVVPTPRSREGVIGLRVERESIRSFL